MALADSELGDLPGGNVTEQRGTTRRLASAADEAIRFLVQLAYTDPVALRRGDLLNLIDGLRRHLAATGPAEAELKLAEKEPATLRAIVDAARQVVEAFANAEEITIPFGEGEMRIDAAGPNVDFSIETGLRNSVLLMAWTLLDVDRAMRINRCPECHTIFYGQLGQVFCTHQCANKRSARKYRQEHREERRRKAQLAYEAKQKARLGPHVKIKRPRRPTDSLGT